MRRILATTTAALAAAAIAVPAATATKGGHPPMFSYAVIGDTPYGDAQVKAFRGDVKEINADPRVRLVLHLGDIKNGSSLCDTSYFEAIRADFDRFEDPLVYTPGDNEWTDCHRANNGAYTPTERLAELRRIFFDAPGRTLGKFRKPVEAQDQPFVENVRWSRDGVEFGTLHVVGSNNDWLPWFAAADLTPEQLEEYRSRNEANLEWLDGIFDRAERNGAAAVVIGIQADMWDGAFTGPNDDPKAYDHFTDTVQVLAERALAFGKPVLLLNGDSHAFVDDHPLADPARPWLRTMYGVAEEVPNLRRITVNGSTTPCHEWLRLRIAPAEAGVFRMERKRFTAQPGFDPAICPV